MGRRVAGLTLLGAGVVLVAAAGVTAFVVAPRLAGIPNDYKPPDTVLEAPGATFLQIKMTGATPSVQFGHATLVSTTTITPAPSASPHVSGNLQGHTVIWNVFQSTKRADTGELVSGTESHLALDRSLGSAVDWAGQCYTDHQTQQSCTPGDVRYSGQQYAFPFGTRKQTYRYFDSVLMTALPIEFQGTETVKGLTTYRFEQVVPEQKLPVPAAQAAMLALLAPGTRGATITYSDTRTVWVEPTTGSIVDYQEQQQRLLVPDGAGPVPLLSATFRYTAATQAAIVKAASDGRSQLLLTGRYLPIGLVLLGVAGLLVGLVLVRSPRRTRTPASAEVPAPRQAAPPPAEATATPVGSGDDPEHTPA